MKLFDLVTESSDAHYGAHIATGYYGGMMSALYALTSTGSLELYPGEGLGRIVGELREAVAIAERHYPEDVDELRAFLAVCEEGWRAE